MSDAISPQDFLATQGLDDWRLTCDGASAFFATASFAESVEFVRAIGALPGIEAHRPAIDIRPGGVTVSTITVAPDNFGMSQRDAAVALGVSGAARNLGLKSDTSQVQGLLVIPGGADVSNLMPFWEAILGYIRRPDSPQEDLIDPRGRGAPFWFEGMEELRGDGDGAIHIALWLPYEEAQARIDAALAAGGHMVRDQYAPRWWTLADAAGNQCDISTIRGRG